MKTEIPFHLQKYIIEQKANKYTPVDQAVWRFTLRQLKNYLSKNAHDCYREGLKATGITVEEIPSINSISKNLNRFGWKAVPVSGFIPPATFLELQALRILPIASDMRTIDNLTYTPAPDIVHEAAGHAPMLSHPEFRKYLEEYAQVARKAIINKEDLALYEVIRDLSDIKEHPRATQKQINDIQKKLNKVSKNMGEPSEAALLARMAWWTTEYGLIGHDEPHIYGAGLLSSAGEGRSALDSHTQKIPFSIDCLKYSYDITEPQPQLFVADDFKTLSRVLQEFAQTMAFNRGGTYGLEIAKKAETVNTVEFENGLQTSGILTKILTQKNEPIYLQFTGPCQLSFDETELEKQGRRRHKEGFGCPVGKIKSERTLDGTTKIIWESGVTLEGELISKIKKSKKNIVSIFKNCRVSFEGKTLFDPKWGEYDLALGEKVVSVFSGAADKKAYGVFEDFTARKIPTRKYTSEQKKLFGLYQKVRNLRKNISKRKNGAAEKELAAILKDLDKNHKKDWLLKLEIFELALQLNQKPSWIKGVEAELRALAIKEKETGPFILEGLRLADRLEI